MQLPSNLTKQEWKYPLFAAKNGDVWEAVRSLNETDLQTVDQHRKLLFEARKRFKLFEIMKRNYGEWDRFIQALEDPNTQIHGDVMCELDRLMLNFLSSFNALFNHFRTHSSRVSTPGSSKEAFKQYERYLEQSSFAFRFLADLRDFVQHCGLPIGNTQRTQDRNGHVTLKVTADAAWLIENCGDWRRVWERSTITKDSGAFDLVALMRELRQVLIDDFGRYVATIYGPRVVETHNFFANLDNEAEQVLGEGAQMIVLESLNTQPGENGAIHYQFSTAILPRDVIKEIGMTVSYTAHSRAAGPDVYVALERMPQPFTPPLKLQEHFRAYNQEYATAGRETQPMPDGTIIWKIVSMGASEAGYMWLDETSDNPQARKVSMAVYSEHADKGLGTAALHKLEKQLDKLQINELRAQVNSNSPNTGLLVRRWLKQQGFVVYDRRDSTLWGLLPDDQYLARCSSPVFLKATYTLSSPDVAPEQT